MCRSTRILSALLALITAFGCAFVFTGCGVIGPTPDIAPHLISEPESEPERPIDSRDTQSLSAVTGTLTAEQYRARVEELYSVVVDDQKKPVFVNNDPVKHIYDAAITILDTYIKNAWHREPDGTLKIVHTIHDYLVCNVDYDFALYERFKNGESISFDPAFDIEGPLVNKLSVCDGLSDAVNFLCAIEGVDSISVKGSFDNVAHAWNKVKIGDYWYNLDVTADSANYTLNESDFSFQLSHGYFLLSDETFRTFEPARHSFNVTGYAALHDYDYYAGKTVTIDGEVYSRVIKSQEELNKLFAAIADNRGTVGKLELKLDFPEKLNVNRSDMYATAIRDAYDKLKNPDFVLTGSSRPYFHYPNGVYLFLMYR